MAGVLIAVDAAQGQRVAAHLLDVATRMRPLRVAAQTDDVFAQALQTAALTERRRPRDFCFGCDHARDGSDRAETAQTLSPLPLVLCDKVGGGRPGLKQRDAAGLSNTGAMAAKMIGRREHE